MNIKNELLQLSKWLNAVPARKSTLFAAGYFLLAMLLLALLDLGSLYGSGSNKTLLNPLMQALPFYLALSAPVLMFGKYARYYIIPVFFFVLTLCASEAVSAWLFHAQLEGDVFNVLAASSKQEVEEFATRFTSWPVFLLLATVIILSTGVCWLICRYPTTTNKFFIYIGLLMLLPYSITTARYCFFLSSGPDFGKAFGKSVVSNMVYELFNNLQESRTLRNMVKNPQLPHDIKLNMDRLLGVVIIGESASRHHLNLYGYPRETSAFLKQISSELFIFKDVISGYATTSNALRLALTITDQASNKPICSVVDLFNAAGIKSCLISNQFRWGPYDGATSMFFSNSSSRQYLTEIKRDSRDIEIVNAFRRKLEDRPGSTNQVFFCHLIGSHTTYNFRYPKDFARFDGLRDELNKNAKEPDTWNEYDNSILYTDFVISEIIKTIKTAKIPAFVLYFSDHGETMNIFRSNQTILRGAYDIPFILWLSPEYRQAYPEFVNNITGNLDKPFQTSRLLYGLLDLAKIRYHKFPEENSIFSHKYKPAQRLIAGKDYDVLYPKNVHVIVP